MRGVTGVVVEPVRGAVGDGVSGFGKGIIRGILGAAVKPAVGVIDLASRAAEGLRNAAAAAIDPRRVRPPRHFDSFDKALRPYSYRENEGWFM